MKIYLEANEGNDVLTFKNFGNYLKTLRLEEQDGSPYITARFVFYGDDDDFEGNLDKFTEYFKFDYDEDAEYFMYGFPGQGPSYNIDYIKAVAIIKEKFGVGDPGYFNKLYVELLKENYSDEYTSAEITKISNKLAGKVKAAENRARSQIDKAKTPVVKVAPTRKELSELKKSATAYVKPLKSALYGSLFEYLENMYKPLLNDLDVYGGVVKGRSDSGEQIYAAQVFVFETVSANYVRKGLIPMKLSIEYMYTQEKIEGSVKNELKRDIQDIIVSAADDNSIVLGNMKTYFSECKDLDTLIKQSPRSWHWTPFQDASEVFNYHTSEITFYFGVEFDPISLI